MAGNRLIEMLAKTAAEKRAMGWMYGGNPYLGGGGYGRWGGYGAGGYGGGYPMMSQSPWGYYGMDPYFRGIAGQGMMQGMRQQQQAFERGLPGIDIGLQGQQADVGGQMQDIAARSPLSQAGQMSSAWGHQEPAWQDLNADPRVGIGRHGGGEERHYQSELGRIADQIQAQEDEVAQARAAAAEASARAHGGFLSRAQLGSMADQGQSLRNMPGNMILGAGQLLGLDMGLTAATEYKKTQEALAAAEDKRRRRLAELNNRKAELQGSLGISQAHRGELSGLGQSAASQSAAREERGRTATGQVQDTFKQGLPAMGRAGEIGTQRMEAPPQPGTQTNVQRQPAPQTQLPPQVQPPRPLAAPKPVQPKPNPGMGGMGPTKAASALVQLADEAARFRLARRQLTKSAGLGDLLGGQDSLIPGAASKTGRGMKTPNVADLITKARAGSGIPSVAQQAVPRPDVSQIMKSLGLEGMPSTLAHLPLESAVGMGIKPEQHAALRKAMGL